MYIGTNQTVAGESKASYKELASPATQLLKNVPRNIPTPWMKTIICSIPGQSLKVSQV